VLATRSDELGQRDRNLAVERSLEALTAEVLAGYVTPSGWSLRGGLSLNRIVSAAEAKVDSTRTITVEAVTEIVIDAAGDTSFVYGEVTSVTDVDRYVRYYNRLTTVDVPLLLGKTFKKDRWRFHAEAGPVFNLRTSGSARYQLPDGEFSTRADNAGLFRNRLTGVGWRGNVSAAFTLRRGLSLNLGLHAVRQPRGGFETAGAATRTFYDLTGVRLGITKRW